MTLPALRWKARPLDVYAGYLGPWRVVSISTRSWGYSVLSHLPHDGGALYGAVAAVPTLAAAKRAAREYVVAWFTSAGALR